MLIAAAARIGAAPTSDGDVEDALVPCAPALAVDAVGVVASGEVGELETATLLLLRSADARRDDPLVLAAAEELDVREGVSLSAARLMMLGEDETVAMDVPLPDADADTDAAAGGDLDRPSLEGAVSSVVPATGFWTRGGGGTPAIVAMT